MNSPQLEDINLKSASLARKKRYEMADAPQSALSALKETAIAEGFFEPVDARHSAFHITRGDALLITFESGQTLWGDEVAQDLGVSSLTVHADGPTWYRSEGMFDFIDALIDDEFFDDFDHVLFAGTGMGAYGAGIFSVANPGSQALLIQPVATLEPDRVPWDKRSLAARRLSWGPRYSFAPRNVLACDKVSVISDPTMPFDAMHASMFMGPHVTQLRAPHTGQHTLANFHGMGILPDLIDAALSGELEPDVFAQMWRERREFRPYLRGLLTRTDAAGRHGLSRMICANVTGRMHAPMFKTRLEELTEAAAD